MITVDTREPWEKVSETFLDLGYSDFRVDTLHHGADFLIESDGGELAVQRKTVSDYLGSLDKLKSTMQDARDHYRTTAILVEGDRMYAGPSVAVRRGKMQQTSVSLKTWHNFLLAQQLRGTLYLRTVKLKDTCRALMYAQQYLDDSVGPPRDGVSQPQQIIQMLPGIGPSRAENIIEEFGDPATALASIRLWSQADGVGEATQEQIIEWLTENHV